MNEEFTQESIGHTQGVSGNRLQPIIERQPPSLLNRTRKHIRWWCASTTHPLALRQIGLCVQIRGVSALFCQWDIVPWNSLIHFSDLAGFIGTTVPADNGAVHKSGLCYHKEDIISKSGTRDFVWVGEMRAGWECEESLNGPDVFSARTSVGC